MPEISELRALLRDRQQKEQLGTETYDISLDTEAVTRYRELEQEKEVLQAESDDAKRQNQPAAKYAKLIKQAESEMAELKTRIVETTITLEFRALTSAKYQKVLANHPDANGDGFNAFVDELIETCYRGCTWKGEPADIGYPEIAQALTFGEYEPVQAVVLAVNRRKVDSPFSEKPSRRTRR